jgi:hypothetical protein
MEKAPWTFTEYKTGTEDIILFCDHDDFATDDGRSWVHKDSGRAFRIGATKRRHGKWSLCGSKAIASTIRVSKRRGKVNGIILCGILDTAQSNDAEDKDASPLSPEARGTFEQLYKLPQGSPGKLQAGSSLYIAHKDLIFVMSSVLLHEMFHHVFGDNS